ncbi:hypothetical protein HHK36_006181 [Tetracentron sinense]|uniref:D-isomer specific 2-hydroxyacid dehydrogenase NAD-binding domain-containing protein n=1 Tax=Tetracentron sinense TaxID=13715 RepID=A0A835DKM2_TETSI|nr:hypothetical protein HHK36_006181 [Tetracentron sinense]
MERLLRKTSRGVVAQLHSIIPVSESPPSPDLQTVLADFKAVFEEPSGLPPPRTHDHRIPFVEGSLPTNVRTDHRSLKYLLEQRISTVTQQKWLSKLLGYDYEIIFRKGADNVAADALSRQFEESGTAMAISFPYTTWVDDATRRWVLDPDLCSIVDKLKENPHSVPHFTWERDILRYKGRLFSGKTVGIVGLGRIGSAIAKRAEAFGCPISYYSRSEKLDSKYKYYSNIIDLAANCHILVVACSLTEETRHIINREVINVLGPKGVVINIGRGQHIDEPELVSALVEGRLGGAGLDVFEHEPEVPEQLFGLDNVVLVPHVGSSTLEARKVMGDLVIGNLEAHFLNKPLLTPVV